MVERSVNRIGNESLSTSIVYDSDENLDYSLVRLTRSDADCVVLDDKYRRNQLPPRENPVASHFLSKC